MVSNVKFKLDISDKGGLYNIGIAATDKKTKWYYSVLENLVRFLILYILIQKLSTPTMQMAVSIDILVKPEKLVIVKISDGKLEYTRQYDIDKAISNPVLTSDSKSPSDAQKYVKAGGLTIQDAMVDESGNVLISMKCRDWHQSIQLSPTGDVTANYFDNTDQDICVSSGI